MVSRLKQAFLAVVMILVPQVFANPIVPVELTELQVTQDGWQIEMHSMIGGLDLNGMYLSSHAGRGFFKDSIQVNEGYLHITPDSLVNSFYIDPLKDTLILHTPDGFEFYYLAYGDSGNTMPVSPLAHQSICLDWYSGRYYLDNTPTLGSPNDTTNAQGHVYGTVTDTLGNPLDGVEVHWFEVDTTDSAGHFHWYGLAMHTHFRLVKENYQSRFLRVMVHPDSSVYVTAEMEPVVHAIDDANNMKPGTCSLSPNYPNPFNNATEFIYTVPWDSPVEIAVYNLTGQVVDILHQGEQQAGEYRMRWEGHDLPSGVYIIQLRTPTEVISRKAILLK